jgi:hypothetical protein
MNMRVHKEELPGMGGEIEIFLDGLPVEIPLANHSLNGIHSHLETVSLEQQRVLCALSIDGVPVNLSLPLNTQETFSRIEAESIALEEGEIRLLKQAQQEANHARDCADTALTLVLINDISVARELWWNLARQIKKPILTLSLLPDEAGGSVTAGASSKKVRKWQIEQITMIIREVDLACATGDTIFLSNTLEKRVLPWLCKLQDLIDLWHETALAGSRLGIRNRAY